MDVLNTLAELNTKASWKGIVDAQISADRFGMVLRLVGGGGEATVMHMVQARVCARRTQGCLPGTGLFRKGRIQRREMVRALPALAVEIQCGGSVEGLKQENTGLSAYLVEAGRLAERGM